MTIDCNRVGCGRAPERITGAPASFGDVRLWLPPLFLLLKNWGGCGSEVGNNQPRHHQPFLVHKASLYAAVLLAGGSIRPPPCCRAFHPIETTPTMTRCPPRTTTPATTTSHRHLSPCWLLRRHHRDLANPSTQKNADRPAGAGRRHRNDHVGPPNLLTLWLYISMVPP
jgi:hypothetical protein